MSTAPFVLGLTGSIGMGKSTTAEMFREFGAAVWDADHAVHQMYAPGGCAVAAIGRLNPAAIVDGAVSREVLRTWISETPNALKQIESIVHPLVQNDRNLFILNTNSEIVVLDIPLLFEKGTEQDLDAVVVVSAPYDVQLNRVLSRPGMSQDMFDRILAQQMPDAQKRARADYVIETTDLNATRQAVQTLMGQIKEGLRNA